TAVAREDRRIVLEPGRSRHRAEAGRSLTRVVLHVDLEHFLIARVEIADHERGAAVIPGEIRQLLPVGTENPLHGATWCAHHGVTPARRALVDGDLAAPAARGVRAFAIG